MPRVRSQSTRQAILVVGDPLDPDDLAEKIELFDEMGQPIGLHGGQFRETRTHTSTSLSPNTYSMGVLTVWPGWRAFRMSTSRPARVRLYPTAEQRDADAARPIGLKPHGNHGRLLEVVTNPAVLDLVLSPAVDMSSIDPLVSDFYITVTNLDTVSGTVVTTFNYVRTE